MAETKKKIKKIVIDRELCIGSASCVINAPGMFELDSDNKAVILQKGDVKNSGPADRVTFADGTIDDGALLAAAQSCPTRAIGVYDEDDQRAYP